MAGLAMPCSVPCHSLFLTTRNTARRRGETGAVFRSVLARDGKQRGSKIDALPYRFSGEWHGKRPVMQPCREKRKESGTDALARNGNRHDGVSFEHLNACEDLGMFSLLRVSLDSFFASANV